MPVTVRVWGCAHNPTVKAQKTSKVGAVNQPRKCSSRVAIERGRLRVGIGGDLWFGDRVRKPPMLACLRPRKQRSRSRHLYEPKTANGPAPQQDSEPPGTDEWVLVPGLVDAPVLVGEVKPVHLAAVRS